MIPKSGHRFSEKIMLKQKARAGWRFEEKSSRSSAGNGSISRNSPRRFRRARDCGASRRRQQAIGGIILASCAENTCACGRARASIHAKALPAIRPTTVSLVGDAPVARYENAWPDLDHAGRFHAGTRIGSSLHVHRHACMVGRARRVLRGRRYHGRSQHRGSRQADDQGHVLHATSPTDAPSSRTQQ
jgi:hypothetical protein